MRGPASPCASSSPASSLLILRQVHYYGESGPLPDRVEVAVPAALSLSRLSLELYRGDVELWGQEQVAKVGGHMHG